VYDPTVGGQYQAGGGAGNYSPIHEDDDDDEDEEVEDEK
jgi:hypothetical protein